MQVSATTKILGPSGTRGDDIRPLFCNRGTPIRKYLHQLFLLSESRSVVLTEHSFMSTLQIPLISRKFRPLDLFG